MSSNLFIAGVDEAGRGPLAGPVTAACVVLPAGYRNPAITDSKKLTESKRKLLFPEIMEVAVAHAIVSVGPRRIERLNILKATKTAMLLAAQRVRSQLSLSRSSPRLILLIDGNARLETSIPQETIIKGDQKLLSIAAASILAKVWRDHLMTLCEERYPAYGLAAHKGYPTPRHRELIQEFGPSKAHRRTFAGVREHLATS